MNQEFGSHGNDSKDESGGDDTLLTGHFIHAMMDDSKRYILLIRPDGVIVRANRMVLRAVNKEREEIEGKHVFHVPELTGPISGERPMDEVIKRIIHGQDCDFEMHYCLDEGRKVYLDCSMQSLSDRSGEPVMVVVEGWNVTELKQSIQDLKSKSFLDDMTNLPNRRFFEIRLREAALRADRMKNKVGVLHVDLDGFTSVTDTNGKNQGDFIILQVSHRLRHVIRGFDIVARCGGDEFLLLIEGITSHSVLVAICDRLLAIIIKPYTLATGEEVALTASIGVSIYPDDGGDQDLILERADIARCRAREAGKNCYKIFGMLE